MEEIMARKGENIYKRKDGRWEGRYRIPQALGTKISYRSVYGHSYREVREKLILRKQALMQPAGKKTQLPPMLTLGDAAGLWLEENRIKWKESTYATYRSITEKHILPLWGTQPAGIFLTEKQLSFPEHPERKEKGNTYSGTYQHQIHVIAGQIFRFLDKKYQCGIPQCPPPPAPVKNKTITPPEGDRLRKLETYLLSRAKDKDPTSIGILLSGCCGLRIGELCALRWENINWEQGTLRIRGTMQRIRTFQQEKGGTKVIVTGPKSRSSNREIPLPAYLLEFLKGIKGTEDGYVLSGKKKEYLEPRTLQYRFKKILEQLEIPYFNFHMLRHIFATNCISRGFDMKTLSELLGHSNITTTMRIYVHSDMERKKQLMAGYRLAS